MSLERPEIPYGFAELEPAMSRDTLVLHFARHRGYFDRAVSLVRGTELDHLDLGSAPAGASARLSGRTLRRETPNG